MAAAGGADPLLGQLLEPLPQRLGSLGIAKPRQKIARQAGGLRQGGMAARRAGGPEEAIPEQAPLGFGKACCELGPITRQLQHGQGQPHGLLGGRASHAQHQIAAGQNLAKSTPHQGNAPGTATHCGAGSVELPAQGVRHRRQVFGVEGPHEGRLDLQPFSAGKARVEMAHHLQHQRQVAQGLGQAAAGQQGQGLGWPFGPGGLPRRRHVEEGVAHEAHLTPQLLAEIHGGERIAAPHGPDSAAAQ